eukprot:scaffold93622_cov49-Attheya_sp.AAC.2
MKDVEEGGRNCFKSARDRDRNKARYQLRERIALQSSPTHDRSSLNIHETIKATANGGVSVDHVEPGPLVTIQNNNEEVFLQKQGEFVRAVSLGQASAFSVATLVEWLEEASRPFPIHLVSTYKIQTLCTSHFGPVYAENVLRFLSQGTCTLMEYAALLGQYRVLSCLLVGGLDLTLRGNPAFQDHPNKSTIFETATRQLGERERSVSARVMKRFHLQTFPIALKCYIVKRVVDMRMAGALESFPYLKKDSEGGNHTLCSIHRCEMCQQSSSTSAPLLNFGAPCHHRFCEWCFWDDLVANVDGRMVGNIVCCPVCNVAPTYSTVVHTLDSCNNDKNCSPLERREKSLERYKGLPKTTRDLKALPHKKKKVHKHELLQSTWSAAVQPSLGSSQDVRRDKWFTFLEKGSVPYVQGCLEAGMCVDVQNDYGQTGLYLASWKGNMPLVRLLLHFGADPQIVAHGNMTMPNVAIANGHLEVFKLLSEANSQSGSTDILRPTLQQRLEQDHDERPNGTVCPPNAHTLIPRSMDHPGAGACYIDYTLSESVINQLIEIWKSLPVEESDAKKQSKGKLCSVRSYFCDAEGYLCHLLSKAIVASNCSACYEKEEEPSLKREAVVFPHMRILHYMHPGSVLAPHVDLSRVDGVTGDRSTHTLILYLYDCDQGGETALLQQVSGTGRDVSLATVQPRRGRLLLFPHSCPHEGLLVESVPKVLVRGEVLFSPRAHSTER